MAGRLDGKIAVVTGSDSGIGQAIAEEFAREGADVLVTYHHDRAGAEETAGRIKAAGRRAVIARLDVREEASVAALFESARQLGLPDILVNDAGRGTSGVPVADTELAKWDDLIRTNLTGPFLCCRAFVRARKAAGGGGKIINVTSVHEATPSPGAAAYGASKGGLLAFTRTLSLEVAGERINVNALAPGLIRTPMTEKVVTDTDKLHAAEQHIPLGRPGEPREIGRLAVYLASAESDYVTGQSFTIDGGLEANWGQGA